LHEFELRWGEVARASWQDAFEQGQADEAERQELSVTIAQGEAPPEQYYRYAFLTERLEGAAASVPAYKAVLERHPEANDARCRLGDVLLEVGDESGIDYLLTSAQAEWSLAPYAYRRIIDHLRASGRSDEAEAYRDRLATADDDYDRAKKAQGSIDEDVELEPLSLDEARRGQLEQRLASVSGVRHLHAAVRWLPLCQASQIVFVFEADDPIRANQVLDNIIQVMLDFGDVFGLLETHEQNWLTKRIRAVPGSQLVPRPGDRDAATETE
jgi:hypothetical protein